MEKVYIMEHPLIQHKISMLRDKNTGTNEFRKLVEEIAVLMGYEAFRDLPTEVWRLRLRSRPARLPLSPVKNWLSFRCFVPALEW